MGGHLGHTKHRGLGGNLPLSCRQWGMVQGCLRGAFQCLIGGEQSSRGGGEVGGDGRGNPVPKGGGGVDGGVVGVGRERPLPLPLHDERAPSLGTKVLKV